MSLMKKIRDKDEEREIQEGLGLGKVVEENDRVVVAGDILMLLRLTSITHKRF